MAKQTKNERIYDVVVFGATGFTGRLVAEYLATRAEAVDPPVRWAIAGRSQDKLEAVKADLVRTHPGCEGLDIVVADLRDWATLVFMAQRTRVVLTTAGPFINNGDRLVHACVSGGADYVDITGEPEFVDQVIEDYHEQARDKGLRIVNCCGFDSIPHDLGAMYTVDQLPRGVPIEVEGFVRTNATFSAGTYRTAITAMSRAREYRERRAASRAEKPASPDDRKVYAIKHRLRYHRELGGWAYPLPSIDGTVVRRSARALERYGPSFGYGHFGIDSKLSRIARMGAGVAAAFALAQFGPTRNYLLDRRQSGEGPSEERRERSFFDVRFVARAGDTRIVTKVSGGDPGYTETARMVVESALCLARDRDRLPGATGVLTPAVAMGELLRQRVQDAGIKFEVVEGG